MDCGIWSDSISLNLCLTRHVFINSGIHHHLFDIRFNRDGWPAAYESSSCTRHRTDSELELHHLLRTTYDLCLAQPWVTSRHAQGNRLTPIPHNAHVNKWTLRAMSLLWSTQFLPPGRPLGLRYVGSALTSLPVTPGDLDSSCCKASPVGRHVPVQMWIRGMIPWLVSLVFVKYS